MIGPFVRAMDRPGPLYRERAMHMESERPSAAWLYLGGEGIEPRCLATDAYVSPLWCLLLAGAEVVPAITPAQVEVQTPGNGLRLSLETAQDNWAQFDAYIRRHPQHNRVPAIGLCLDAVAAFLQRAAEASEGPLQALWLQGDLDAVSGPFDANTDSRIGFWKWNADTRLQALQAGTVDLHDITLVLDYENLDEWVRAFGLDTLDHPWFRALAHLEGFAGLQVPFAELEAPAEAKPLPVGLDEHDIALDPGPEHEPENELELDEPAPPPVSPGEWARRYQAGDPAAALALSRLAEDPAQAMDWARRACGLEGAAEPTAAAWLRLAQLAFERAGSTDELLQARGWVERAQALDHQLDEVYALLLLQARLWLDADAGPVDGARAFAALERLLLLSGRNQAVHTEGLHLLGICRRDGLGCPADPEAARVSWRSAASDGHGPATQALVELLAAQADAEEDAEAAERLWLEALNHAEVYLECFAEEGDPRVLAFMHGFCGELALRTDSIDWEAAELHLVRAAEAGNVDAMGLLAIDVYRNRQSPLRDLKRALHWAWRYGVATGVLKSADAGWQRWVFALFWLLRG